MQEAMEYINERDSQMKGIYQKKKKMKYRTKNKNMERKKGNSIPFYVRTACSGKLVISLVYT